MEEHYKIINDVDELHRFIGWLPELQPDETFYLCLFARSKYCKGITHIKSDKIQMKRFTADKWWLETKIRQLEAPIGSYRQKDIPIPQEALALYITPNPRNLMQATRRSLIKMAELLTKPYNGWNPQSEVMSEIQKSKSRTCFIDFDFDNATLEEVEEWINFGINVEACTMLKTRGGVHLLVNQEKVEKRYKSTFYNHMRKHPKCDIGKQNMMPVPGCTQGGFTPYIIY